MTEGKAGELAGLGRRVGATEYVGLKVYRRSGRGKPGVVVGTRGCQLEGCRGTAIITRWPDGKITVPCARGCKERGKDGLQIL